MFATTVSSSFNCRIRLAYADGCSPAGVFTVRFARLGFSPVWLYNRLGLNPMKTIAVSVQDVAAAVLVAGGKIVHTVPVEEEPNPSLFYFVVRR